jgi:hypothetical protein
LVYASEGREGEGEWVEFEVEEIEWYLHANSKVKTMTSMNVVNATNSGSPTTSV